MAVEKEPKKMKHEFSFDQEQPERLDRFLQVRLAPEVTRSSIQRWIRQGCVTINGQAIAKTGYQLTRGDHVEARPPERDSVGEDQAIDMSLNVLYEDEWLAVVEKPAGIAVHPAPSIRDATLVNGLLHRFQRLSDCAGPSRTGIVHRLDRETSGAILVAKDNETHRMLAGMFQDRRMVKVYQAVTYGRFRHGEGTLDHPLGRSSSDRKRIVVRRDGRQAVSHYKVMEEIGMFSLVNVSLETGRTHQIRVHLSHVGHPIVGDKLYGTGRWKGIEDRQLRAEIRKFPRHALHAGLLRFVHPVTGTEVKVRAPLAQDLEQLLDRLRAFIPDRNPE